MVRALLAVGRVVRSAWLVELVGAALLTGAAYEAWGLAAALGTAGAGLVLKAYELDGDG